ncbi:unnamed protein product [Bursaphelenchus xylophilus]|uniref:(pine wood nematode) hypothetical protein n=1 Tax=Bursaphelenchus xylophilus TaxID=6326 RepID=A0A1I7SWD9_BURXY|nr:unnamed protein product [Bursaphelenchus xylophilus]CAG9099261.1 unnamed protein product [Bursaphelenchus xylophilus]
MTGTAVATQTTAAFRRNRPLGLCGTCGKRKSVQIKFGQLAEVRPDGRASDFSVPKPLAERMAKERPTP